MKNKNGFTLVELLAVIVILAIVTVIATQTVLPYMSTAREDAFRIEANGAVKGAETAMNLYALGDISLTQDNTSRCINNTAKKACFTIDALIELGAYDGDADSYDGKVEVTWKNTADYSYKLYFKKGAEFAIIGEGKNYNKKDIELTPVTSFDDTTNTTCSCTS